MPTVAECRSLLAGVPTAVVIFVSVDVAIAVLDFHDLDIGREIDVVVGRDPLIRPKPEADGVLEACRLLGVDPTSAVMIGDSSWDGQAALAAGAGFIGVPPGGFDESMRSRIHTAPTMADALAVLGLQG
jgi:phosphoglycolate phosphatase-like HAD superfamily hydrolase